MNKTQLDKTLKTIKNYVDTTSAKYLPLTGGTVTGDIKFNKNNRTGTIFNIFGGDANGHGVNFGGNGMTIVSAGESGNALVTAETLDGIQEHLMLTADQSIKFYTNCNTIGNRKSAILSTNLYFYPSTTGTGSVGTTDNKWNSMYANTINATTINATTFYGALNGNASTASSAAKLTTARTISLTGDVTGSASFNGSANVSITTTVANNSHTHNYAGSSSAGGIANSSYKLEVKANNTVTKTADDTTANWGVHGNSVHWYTNTGQLTDQPSQWGYLLNIGKENEVHQLWMTQSSGNLAHRGGNASGWAGSWRTILDSENYSSYALPLTGGTLTGKITFENQLGGGGLTSLINCNALHSATGNGQMMTANGGTIYVGNPNTPIIIEGSATPTVNVNGTVCYMYHTGNKPSPSDIGASESGHVHHQVASLGNVTAETGANHPSQPGLSMRHVYNNGYPVPYGNVITLRGSGSNQILTEWSGSDAGAGRLYIRNKRDTSGDWSAWAQVYTSTHKPSPADIGAATSGHNHDSAYLKLSGGTLTGKITFANQLGGGGLSSLINCNDLQNGTGNGQLITASGNHIYVGNPKTPITIEGNTHPKVNVNGTEYTMYHTGNKPSLADIGAAAASHNHGLLHSDLGVTIANTSTDSGWSMINSSYGGYILKSIRSNQYAPSWHMGNYAAGICFGGADTKGVISCSYDHGEVRFAGGNGSKPVWWFGLQGTSGTTYNLASFNAAKWGGYSIVAAAGKTSGTANTITFTW